MHIQIFQMAFNSCYPFWRQSICEKSHFWCFGNQRRTEVGEAGEVEKVKKSKKSRSQRSWRSWWSFQDFKISRFQDFKIQDFNIPIITSSYKFEKMKNTKSMLRNSSMSSTEVELVGFRRYSSPLQWSILPKCNSSSQKVMVLPDISFLRFLAEW